MSYYETVTSKSSFDRKTKGAKDFSTLFKAPNFHRVASNWGRDHLFACRVICTAPRNRLELLKNSFPPNLKEIHPCIQSLIAGPDSGGIEGLAALWEPQIVQRNQPDIVGFVWAALARLIRGEREHSPKDRASAGAGPSRAGLDRDGEGAPSRESTEREPAPGRPTRKRNAPQRFADYVSSAALQVESSSSETASSRSKSVMSIGFVEQPASGALKEATIRLASCFIRCVLNYAQPPDKSLPYVHFRDERFAFHCDLSTPEQLHLTAIDDGGVQLYEDNRGYVQVALLEGKRGFHGDLADGKPALTDEMLAQMVGEVLVAQGWQPRRLIDSGNQIVILASAHYMRFFHFSMPGGHISKLAAESSQLTNNAAHLRVESSQWFSLKTENHRAEIASHILAMVKWADDQICDRRRSSGV